MKSKKERLLEKIYEDFLQIHKRKRASQRSEAGSV